MCGQEHDKRRRPFLPFSESQEVVDLDRIAREQTRLQSVHLASFDLTHDINR